MNPENPTHVIMFFGDLRVTTLHQAQGLLKHDNFVNSFTTICTKERAYADRPDIEVCLDTTGPGCAIDILQCFARDLMEDAPGCSGIVILPVGPNPSTVIQAHLLVGSEALVDVLLDSEHEKTFISVGNAQALSDRGMDFVKKLTDGGRINPLRLTVTY